MQEKGASVSAGVRVGNDPAGGPAPPYNACTGRGFFLRALRALGVPMLPLRRLLRLVRSQAPPSPSESTKRRRLRIYCRDRFTCQYCGRDLLADADGLAQATLDHVHPTSKGGQNTPDNLATACLSCNLLKADSPARSIAHARAIVQFQRTRLRETHDKYSSTLLAAMEATA